MRALKDSQLGGFDFKSLLITLIFAYGIFLAIQYVPIVLEERALESAMGTLERNHRQKRISKKQEAELQMANILSVSDMAEKVELFNIRQNGQEVIVEMDYEREINFLFNKKVMHFNEYVTLSP